MSKLSDIIKIGTGIGKQFAPPAVGGILDAVTKSIADKGDPQNEGALKVLANRCDELEQAVLALHGRLKAVEGKQH